jgi:glycosyltransferase involved in cell wall biosynthesis
MTKMADVLFVHNNFPGQYKLLAKYLAAQDGVRVFAIGAHSATALDGVELQRYRLRTDAGRTVHSFAQRFEVECRRAEQVIYAANVLKLAGMKPRIIFVHPGWGESLPLRQLFPDAKICVYCEFYYSPHGSDVGFDPEFNAYGIDGQARIRLRNASTLLALADADIGIAPTHWQQSLFPAEFRPKIRVLHDGIDTDALSPHPARFSHPQLPQPLKSGDEVVTFVSRSLEPYRGFHTFMRALPAILAIRPKAQVCIVGGDDVSYGSPPANGDTWKGVMLNELGSRLPAGRVHFLDRLPYDQLMALFRVSRAHVYLTYPFVLSWSLLEAMALGCTVVASDVAPVREVITDGDNGFLVPFFDAEALASRTIDILGAPAKFDAARRRAAASIRESYDFESRMLPKFLKLIRELMPDVALTNTPARASRAANRTSAILETSHA